MRMRVPARFHWRRLGLLLGGLAAAGCGQDSTGPRPVASAMRILGGTTQSGTVSQPLDTALTVQLVDKFGEPVRGVLVRFSAPNGNGTLSPVTITTGPEGQAQSIWTLPPVGGTYHAYAVAAGVDSVSFTASAVPSHPATIDLVRGDSQSQLVGQRLDSVVEVRVRDSFGNPVPGVVVHFAAISGQGTPGTSTATTSSLGLASTTWSLGSSAGLMALTVTVDTLPPVSFHATAHYVTPALVDLSLGDEHGCAIAAAGTVRCWGVNRANEVSPGTSFVYAPVDAAGGGVTARTIAAGNNHSCAIATDNATYCWGQQGLIGSSSSGSTAAVVDGNHAFVAISAGFSHTCGVEADGAAWCWGWNDHGQLGDGTLGNFPTSPVRVSGAVEFAWVSAGSSFSCGLSRAGQLYCWGLNDQGQLLLPASAEVTTPTAVAPGMAFLDVDAGVSHSCAIALDHRAYCWGSNGGGKLGGDPGSLLVLVDGNHRFRSIGAGGEHTCGVDLGGALFCWGSNLHGAIGSVSALDINMSPQQVSPGGFSAVALGYQSSCARAADGSVYCWGDNRVGTLGIGHTGLVPTPVAVVSPAPFQTIGIGQNHTCASTATQVAYCWGENFYGAVGVSPAFRPESLPQVAIAGAPVVSLAVGYEHTCAVVGTGAACWGLGGYLGQGSNTFSNFDPVAVPSGATWTQVATSYERTCGLAADSTAWCWGYGTAPTVVPGGFKFTHLVVGDVVSCGLEADSTARCWVDPNPAAPPASVGTGYVSLTTSAGGACGLDATGQAICWTAGLIPSALATPLRFVALSGGASGTTCGVAVGGAAYCWGENDFGQLGDGSLAPQAAPTAVAGGHSFVTISAGAYHTCALDAAGAAYCWGQNWWGQLGNGGTAFVPVPTKVF